MLEKLLITALWWGAVAFAIGYGFVMGVYLSASTVYVLDSEPLIEKTEKLVAAVTSLVSSFTK